METVTDIINEMRKNNPPEYYMAEYGGGEVPNEIRILADRLESAYRRDLKRFGKMVLVNRGLEDASRDCLEAGIRAYYREEGL